MSEGGNVNTSQAFADALARARQLAAKLTSGAAAASAAAVTSPPHSAGLKRSADDFQSEPDSKRSAAMSDPFGAQLAAMKSVGGGLSSSGPSYPAGMGITMGLGIGGSGAACTEEIKIPDALVGLIIGRGGEQVSRIQAETGCKVQVAPDNGTGKDRSCYLQGTKESIERAKELVMEIVSSKSHELGRPGGGLNSGVSDQRPKMNLGIGLGLGGGGGGGGPGGAPPGSTTIEMMIPGAKVGLIIGKGGETIRNLQDKSSTKMYILQENMFEECDKPLRIVGESDLVEHARQLVLELITDTPPKNDFMKPKSEYGGGGGFGGSGGALAFGMETMKFPVPKISVGLIIGKGGDMIKRIQMETGAKVQFDPINSTMGDMDEQLAIITGKPDQLRQAQLRIEELVETALQHGGKAGGGPGGHGMDGRVARNPNSWDGGNQGYQQNNRRGDFEEERMSVPVNRVGMIIGKGGETIRTINQQSGAHCEIDRNSQQGDQERVFVIRGSRSQIEHAKELIMEKVNTLPPPKGRDNRGGGYGGGGHGEYGGQGGQHQQQWGGNQGGGGHGGQQWGGQAANQGDPSKMGDTNAQWAAYYAQYYGQAAQTHGGQQDYTQQWIEYLRAQGQHQQADMLEQQSKAAKQAEGGQAGSASTGGNPAPPGTGATNGNGNGAGQTADYSQQWADHYRAMGKIAEAEAIEAYIKSQKGAGGGQGVGGQAPGGAQGVRPGGPGPGYPGAYQNNSYGAGGYAGYQGYGNAPYPGPQQQGPGGQHKQSGSGGTAPPGTEEK